MLFTLHFNSVNIYKVCLSSKIDTYVISRRHISVHLSQHPKNWLTWLPELHQTMFCEFATFQGALIPSPMCP